jgi:multidrug efflux system outer membrane protein
VRTIQSEIVSEIASLYYELMALDEQLSITEQTVKNWDTTVITMRSLQASARVTEAAVVQSVAQREATAVTIPDINQSIRQTENALSILLGMPPSAVGRGRLEDQLAVAMLNTGVPAQLLANRPDVQQAEQDFRVAFELTNVARTAFYPTLSITGSANYASFNINNLFDVSSLGASVLGGLTQPIFNRRLNKTKLEVAKEQQQAALLSFKNTLLIAGQEVADALSLHVAAMDKMGDRSNEITALQKSVDYTQELLQNGFANYTEVITARQTLLEAQLGRVNDKLQELQSTVSLYTALGGGWR